MKTSCRVRSLGAHTLPPSSSPHLRFCICTYRPGGCGKLYSVMSHPEGGEFASRSPLPPLRHPGAPQPPSLVSEHVWFGPFYKCVTLFAFSVSLSRIFRQLRSQFCFSFLWIFLLSVFLSIQRALSSSLASLFSSLMLHPSKRDVYLPRFRDSSPPPSLKFLFVSTPQAGFIEIRGRGRSQTRRGCPLLRFNFQIKWLFVEFQNIPLIKPILAWPSEGVYEISFGIALCACQISFHSILSVYFFI